MANKMVFPRNVYKSGGNKKWGRNKKYSTVMVESKEEFDAALKDGWLESFQEAIDGAEEAPEDGSPVSKEKKTFFGIGGKKKAEDKDDF